MHRLVQHSVGLYIAAIVLGELYTWAYQRKNPAALIQRIENDLLLDMLPCKQQFNYCYKDVDMEQKLIAMTDVYCVFCGHKNDRLD
jgi:hypothetical protein